MRSDSSRQWNPAVARGAVGCTPPSMWVSSCASTDADWFQQPLSTRAKVARTPGLALA